MRVRFVGGRFVAVGFAGTIASSTDGLTWSARREDFQNFATLNDVAFGDGLFVVVGLSGAIATTPDGDAFTQQVSRTSRVLGGIVFDGSQFVAVGEDRVVDRSLDGIEWEVQ